MTPPPFFVAYIDPGTGSYVLQLALAGILGASYAVKHFWARLKGIFGRGPADDVNEARAEKRA